MPVPHQQLFFQLFNPHSLSCQGLTHKVVAAAMVQASLRSEPSHLRAHSRTPRPPAADCSPVDCVGNVAPLPPSAVTRAAERGCTPSETASENLPHWSHCSRPPSVIDRLVQSPVKSLHFPLRLRMPHPPVYQVNPLFDQIHTQARQPPSVGGAPPRCPMIQQQCFR